MSVLYFTPNGTYGIKTTLSDALLAANVAGMTIVITTAQILTQSYIVTDREIVLVKGGSIAYGSYSITVTLPSGVTVYNAANPIRTTPDIEAALKASIADVSSALPAALAAVDAALVEIDAALLEVNAAIAAAAAGRLSGIYQYDTWDKIYAVGRSTLTGSNAGAGTYVMVGHPLPAGVLKTFSVFSLGIGTLKLKRYTRTNEEYVYAESVDVAVTAGLNEFTGETVPTMFFDEGDVLGIYTPGGLISYLASVTPTGYTNYSLLSGDDITTPLLTVADYGSTTQLQFIAEIAYSPVGRYTINDYEPHSLTLGLPVDSALDDRNAENGSVVIYSTPVLRDAEIVSVSAKCTDYAIVNFLVFEVASTGVITVTRNFLTEFGSGVTTKTAGLDFQTGVIIPTGGMLGYVVLAGELRIDPYENAIPTGGILGSVGYELTSHPVKYFELGYTLPGMLQVTTKQPNIYPAKNYIVDRLFDTVAPGMNFNMQLTTAPTTWSLVDGQAQSSGTGLANSMGYFRGTYYSNITYRIWATPGTGASLAVYTYPNTGGTSGVGTMVSLDVATNAINVHEVFTGSAPTTVPAVWQTKTPAFTLTAGVEYVVDLTRDGKTCTVSITDPVTGVSEGWTWQPMTGGHGGRISGAPCVAALAGVVRVRKMQYLCPVDAPKVIIFGDSITEGSGATTGYAIDICAEVGGVHSGVSGDTLAGMLTRVHSDLSLTDFTYAIIYIGTNDYAVNTATWLASLAKVVAMVESRGVIPVVCTLCPIDDYPDFAAAVNAGIVSAGYRVIRFDRALTVDSDGVTRDTAKFTDALHPNDTGVAAMVARVRIDLPELFD